MDDNVKYTQNDDGSRSFTLTLTSEQLAKDQFLGNMKDGADLFKSWENQKSMIGKNSIPNADAPESDWQKIYEKARPANGYGLDEKLEKFASDNGLNKYQATKFAEYVNGLTAPDPNDTGATNLMERLTKEWGEKTAEKVAGVNAVMKQTWTEEENKAFESLPNSMQVSIAKAIDSVLSAFGVKGADFQVGKGGTPATAPASDRAGYDKERREMMEKGQFTDMMDKALRKKYNVGYIDIKKFMNF